MDTKSVQKNWWSIENHVPLKDHGKEYKIDKLIT